MLEWKIMTTGFFRTGFFKTGFFNWATLLACVALATGALATEAAETAESDSTEAAAAPSQIVDTLHEKLLQVMKNATALGYEGRVKQLAPVVNELFDLSFMAEKSIGRHWKTINEDQRSRLLTIFSRFTVANYAGRFSGHSGQIFETMKEEPSGHNTILVHSRLLGTDGDSVQLNYRLRQVDSRWRIIDVYLNGTVSELALRRSEYSSLIKREGFAALLSALDKRIDDFAASDEATKATPAESG
jgi:phospholipid transport system substrate-binding protein